MRHERIRIEVGRTIELAAKMTVGSVSEALTVPGAAAADRAAHGSQRLADHHARARRWGDSAALEAYEAAHRANPPPARGRRHRIEHLEATAASDLPRFASLGVIASLQPAHSRGMLNPNPNGGRVLSIGPERHASGWPWKSIAEGGGRIIFGSDWPVASLNPVGTFYVPLTRGPRPGVADERLTMTQVIDAYTKTGAWAEFEENSKGTLETGKLADVVILSKDVFADPPGDRRRCGNGPDDFQRLDRVQALTRLAA